MTNNFALLLIPLALTSCVFYVSSIPKIQAPNATYLHTGCQAELGGKTTAYYPFHGIYVSIDLNDSRFGLHIPSGTVVVLEGKIVKIEGLIGATANQATPNLRATSHSSVGVGYAPVQFMETIDHYTTPDNFGPLEGSGNGSYLLWYLYMMMTAEDSHQMFHVPKGLTEGTIELPAMTINGQHYDPQILTFKRESFTGLAAVTRGFVRLQMRPK